MGLVDSDGRLVVGALFLDTGVEPFLGPVNQWFVAALSNTTICQGDTDGFETYRSIKRMEKSFMTSYSTVFGVFLLCIVPSTQLPGTD